MAVPKRKTSKSKRMRKSSRNNSRKEKAIARKKYWERQFDKWVNWSVNTLGYVKYQDIIEYRKKYKLE